MSPTEFYYNVSTGEIEEGRQGPWGDLMGPYPTREAAVAALETAAERNEEADELDRRWND